MTNSQNLPVFDRDRALSLLDNDEELLADVLDLFKTSGRSLVDQITEAASSADFAVLASAAHGLKGAAGNIAAERIRQLSAQLESDAKAGTVSDPVEMAAAIATEFDAFQRQVPDLV